MKKLSFILILIFSLVVSPSYAISAQKRASIEKMFKVMGIEKRLSLGFETMLPAIDQLSSKLQLDFLEKEELKSVYRDWFYNDIDHAVIQNKLIKIYSDAYSDKEINEIIAFYESPIGQKTLKVTPKLVKLGAQVGMQEGRAKQKLLIERIKRFMAKIKQKREAQSQSK